MAEELTAEERALEKKQRKVKLRQQVLMEHYRNVMATVAGRAVLWHILQQCRLNATSYAEDVNLTLRYEGMRDVGLNLLADINTVDPHAYIRLMEQAREYDDREREEHDDRTDD